MSDTVQQDAFKFFDGLEWSFADPGEVNRRLWFLLGNPQALADKINAVAARLNEATADEIKEATAARVALVQAIREAFEMQPFDKKTGRGATNLSCLAVYQQFCSFMRQQEEAATAAPVP